MSDHLDVHADDDTFLERRRGVLLAPAILATCVGLPLLALSLLLQVAAAVLLHAHPDWLPAGTNYLAPSGSERARIIAREGLPILAGLGFLVLTWRYRHQGRRVATCVCAVATVLMGVLSLW